jgi:hypothetical protein
MFFKRPIGSLPSSEIPDELSHKNLIFHKITFSAYKTVLKCWSVKGLVLEEVSQSTQNLSEKMKSQHMSS